MSCGGTRERETLVEKKIFFDGNGCVISQAAASLLTDAVVDKSLQEVSELDKEYMIAMLNNIQIGPIRLRCLLLSLEALQMGVRAYQTKGSERLCSIEQSLCKSAPK